MDDKIRRIMYGGLEDDLETDTVSNEQTKENMIEVRASRDSVIVLIEGKKHQIPSWKAFESLQKENNSLRKEQRKLLIEAKQLRLVVGKLTREVNEIGDELKRKMDAP